MALLDQKDREEIVECQDLLDPKESMVMLEGLDHQDCR